VRALLFEESKMSEVEATVQDDVRVGEFLEAFSQNPQQVSVTICEGQKTVQIRRMSGTQVIVVLRILKTIAEKLSIKDFAELSALEVILANPLTFLDMMSGNLDYVLELVGDLVGMQREEVRKLELDDLILCIYACWRVNERFFTQRLMPMISALQRQ
jgi:hypothetical protein